MPKICFITAIFGNYEITCKKFVKQTIETDFICFTDNPNIKSNGWIIDTTPYHINNNDLGKQTGYINSILNNKHTFNIAKYYKQSFNNVPRLKDYDIIIWLDGTVEIINKKVSEYISKHIWSKKIIGWNHENRNGILKNEVDASNFSRYTSTYWHGQKQPYQDINKQYDEYIKDGYTDNFFKKINNIDKHFGVWVTCFVAFLQKDKIVNDFLKMWYLQILQYTTQDQISFPYVCYKQNLIPYTLPNQNIKGNFPHEKTDFYIKHSHGI